MAKHMRNHIQGVVLLSFVFVVCLACLGYANGESINDYGSNKVKSVQEGYITPPPPPCYRNTHMVVGNKFCCKKDKLCWSDLGVCFTNCPCKIDCPSPPVTQ
uniref:Uncharacterized protein n=1 Tax=Aegilops tauschii subsp. strangulata TaxID=200361 RepID=A0A453GWG4_AEGTS